MKNAPIDRFQENMPLSTEFGLQTLKDQGLQLSVGQYSYGVPAVSWARADQQRSLSIGSYCSIAAGVSIYVGLQGRHTTDFLSTYPINMIFGPSPISSVSQAHQGNLDVTIGSDVWIGRDALILAGVTIGDGAVIGSRAVVTSDVPPYSIVGGIPAKIMRYRFDKDIIDRLLQLQWWNLPEDILIQNISLFNTADMKMTVSCLEKIKDSMDITATSSDMPNI